MSPEFLTNCTLIGCRADHLRLVDKSPVLERDSMINWIEMATVTADGMIPVLDSKGRVTRYIPGPKRTWDKNDQKAADEAAAMNRRMHPSYGMIRK